MELYSYVRLSGLKQIKDQTGTGHNDPDRRQKQCDIEPSEVENEVSTEGTV